MSTDDEQETPSSVETDDDDDGDTSACSQLGTRKLLAAMELSGGIGGN